MDIPLPEERALRGSRPRNCSADKLAAMTAWYLAAKRRGRSLLCSPLRTCTGQNPTSLDLMRGLAERGAQAPLLIHCHHAARVPSAMELALSPHSVISLSPLDRAEVAQMVGELAARHALSQEVVEGVSERTGGVPRCSSRRSLAFCSSEEAARSAAYRRSDPADAAAIARGAALDQLGEAREVAQIGAVLGRDFTYALLRALGGIDVRPPVPPSIDSLTRTLLIAQGHRP